MLGIFKKFWPRSGSSTAAAPSSPFTPPAHGGASAASAARPAMPNKSASPGSTSAEKANAGYVGIAMASIEPSLPEPLRHKISGALQQAVTLPVDLIVPQLPQGIVSLTVSQLRGCAPDLLASLADHDQLAVVLPLG